MNALLNELQEVEYTLLSKGLVTELCAERTSTTCNLWKSYMKLSSPLNIGLLHAGTKEEDPSGEERTIDDVIRRLEIEHNNYCILLREGFPVPEMYGHLLQNPVVKIYSHGYMQRAGIIVQHLDELSVHNVNHHLQWMREDIANLSPDKQEKSRSDYALIKNLCAMLCPCDLQLLLTKEGNLYVIDVETIGPGKIIPDL